MSETIKQGGVHLGVAKDSGPFAVLQRLRWSAAVPFAEMPTAFQQLQYLLLRKPGDDREMVDTLTPVASR